VLQAFVKYNGVLRGLQSDSAFLKGAMVKLCCPESIAEQYAAGSVAFGGSCVTLCCVVSVTRSLKLET